MAVFGDSFYNIIPKIPFRQYIFINCPIMRIHNWVENVNLQLRRK